MAVLKMQRISICALKKDRKVIRGGEIKIGDIMFAERAESFK